VGVTSLALQKLILREFFEIQLKKKCGASSIAEEREEKE